VPKKVEKVDSEKKKKEKKVRRRFKKKSFRDVINKLMEVVGSSGE